MPIQLDKILENIAKEKVLHPNNSDASKKEIDEAWARVGRNNKLSVHESRSIFKVLQKKYEQERLKDNSAWKLFGLMQQIHQANEPKLIPKEEEEQMHMDDVEEYEMLEVQEPEDEDEPPSTQLTQTGATNSTGSASDGESPSKSMGSSSGSPEKDEKQFVRNAMVGTPRPPPLEEKKLLNSLAHTTPRNTQSSGSAATAAAALQKKGITVKKTSITNAGSSKSIINTAGVQSAATQHKKSPQRTTIQLPDSLKRKLSDDIPQSHTTISKKSHIMEKASPKSSTNTTTNANASNPIVHTTTAQLLQVKKEQQREAAQTPPPGINIITIPANPTRVELANGGAIGAATSSTAATVASTSTNGFSPRIEDIDFKNDIIFDAGAALNGSAMTTKMNAHGNEIINLGNFDNSLPPTFFKNLCNSTRHEALGLYVSNVMNRLSTRAAAKLEISILRAILDVQSDELEE